MDKEKKSEKIAIAKEASKAYRDLEESVRMENIVKDNKIEFKSGDKNYRIRKPNLEEQQEIDDVRRKKYLELMRDDSYLFRKQWVKEYKKKGIDIDKMDNDIKLKGNKIKELLLKLATLNDKKLIGELKDQILKLRDEQYLLNMEKTDLLSYSIEDQLMIYVNSYTACVILERKEKDKWVKQFKDYDEFQKCEDMDLINNIFYFLNYLLFSEVQ